MKEVFQAKIHKQTGRVFKLIVWRTPPKFLHWDHDVLKRRELRKEKMELKHETDLLKAHRCHLARGKLRCAGAFDHHLAGCRPVKQAKQIEQ